MTPIPVALFGARKQHLMVTPPLTLCGAPAVQPGEECRRGRVTSELIASMVPCKECAIAAEEER